MASAEHIRSLPIGLSYHNEPRVNQMDNKQEQNKPGQQNQNPGQKPGQQQQGGGQKPGQQKQGDDIHPESADQGNRNTDYSGGS